MYNPGHQIYNAMSVRSGEENIYAHAANMYEPIYNVVPAESAYELADDFGRFPVMFPQTGNVIAPSNVSGTSNTFSPRNILGLFQRPIFDTPNTRNIVPETIPDSKNISSPAVKTLHASDNVIKPDPKPLVIPYSNGTSKSEAKPRQVLAKEPLKEPSKDSTGRASTRDEISRSSKTITSKTRPEKK